MAKDRIDEQLVQLYAELKEFRAIGDRTKAIEDLARRVAEVGEAQIAKVSDLIAKLSAELQTTAKGIAAIPAQIDSANGRLKKSATDDIVELEAATSRLHVETKSSSDVLDKSIRALEKSAKMVADAMDKKIKDATKESGLDDVAGLAKRIAKMEKNISEIGVWAEAMTEAQKAQSSELSTMRTMIAGIHAAVEKIPTKRGLFG